LKASNLIYKYNVVDILHMLSHTSPTVMAICITKTTILMLCKRIPNINAVWVPEGVSGTLKNLCPKGSLFRKEDEEKYWKGKSRFTWKIANKNVVGWSL